LTSIYSCIIGSDKLWLSIYKNKIMDNLPSNIRNLEKETFFNISQSKSPNTIRAYKSDFADFAVFCKSNNLKSMPSDVKSLTIYLTFLFKKKQKFSTIKRKLISISQVHKIKGYYIDVKNPLIIENLLGIKRQLGADQKGKKPLSIDHLRQIIEKIDEEKISELKKIRDKAIILLGFAGGFRRSELTNLDVEDVEFVDEGLKIILKKSKTDPFGKGLTKAIPFFENVKFCPVKNLKLWLEKSCINKGKIFCRLTKSNNIFFKKITDQSIAKLIKHYLNRIGVQNKNFSAHSLRSGFATATAEAGADERSIMNMTGHKSVQMVRRYIKETNLFKNNPLKKINL